MAPTGAEADSQQYNTQFEAEGRTVLAVRPFPLYRERDLPHMKKQEDKAIVLRAIISAAEMYSTQMVNRTFLYVFEGRHIEVTYRAKEFRHLTGVKTSLSAIDFYRNAVNKTLTPEQIEFDPQRHPYDLCLHKSRYIQHLLAVTNSDLIILEDVSTGHARFQFGLTELNFTLCLDRDLDFNGQPKSHYYIAISLRHGDAFDRSGAQYECNCIFSKDKDKGLYDTLCYSDGKVAIQVLPEEVRQKLDPALLPQTQE